ncbi:pantoate--beta-alanine ligase [Lacinutrix neustonica]|uniref:Pantothenate synthetase n=1 Tax=Lacinutrix neustonica TaxID=2980107 RepID=A0A9E8SC23_9FLAO|nr:pantoate--beta-alanine ligase [Lacinutrix neustonica]WAC00843.1 pantoate--beta-alanine ligase [Lacinutrix neustonica]
MTVFRDKTKIQKHIAYYKAKGSTFGFVPTMGALHQGHLALVREALANNTICVVSIFVNPTQFNNAKDLEKYPRTLEKDVELLETVSKDIVIYAPTVADVYGTDAKAEHFSFDGLEFEMEGKFRKGHFDGVGTIVKRLFEIVKPDQAYFGEKDYQQLVIIKKLTQKYNLPVKVNGCKIHREQSGPAMSSRNIRLKSNYKMAAPFIYQTLQAAKLKFGTKSANEITAWVENQFAKHKLLELEYFIIADVETLQPVKRKTKTKTYRAFIATYADDIRLIDNIALN